MSGTVQLFVEKIFDPDVRWWKWDEEKDESVSTWVDNEENRAKLFGGDYHGIRVTLTIQQGFSPPGVYIFKYSDSYHDNSLAKVQGMKEVLFALYGDIDVVEVDVVEQDFAL